MSKCQSFRDPVSLGVIAGFLAVLLSVMMAFPLATVALLLPPAIARRSGRMVWVAFRDGLIFWFLATIGLLLIFPIRPGMGAPVVQQALPTAGIFNEYARQLPFATLLHYVVVTGFCYLRLISYCGLPPRWSNRAGHLLLVGAVTGSTLLFWWSTDFFIAFPYHEYGWKSSLDEATAKYLWVGSFMLMAVSWVFGEVLILRSLFAKRSSTSAEPNQ